MQGNYNVNTKKTHTEITTFIISLKTRCVSMFTCYCVYIVISLHCFSFVSMFTYYLVYDRDWLTYEQGFRCLGHEFWLGTFVLY
jgi:hypothetical protein